MLRKLFTSLVLSAVLVGILYAFRGFGGEIFTAVGAILLGIASMTLTMLFTDGDSFVFLPNSIEVVFNVIVYAVFILLLRRIVRDLREKLS